MVPCAGLFRQKAEEGWTLDALPLLRREALKKARALWSLVWKVLVRGARGVVITAVNPKPEGLSQRLGGLRAMSLHESEISGGSKSSKTKKNQPANQPNS